MMGYVFRDVVVSYFVVGILRIEDIFYCSFCRFVFSENDIFMVWI